MTKITLITALILILGGLGFYFYTNSTVSYVAALDDGMVELETELKSLSEEANNGTLTAEAAVVAQAKITTKLAEIDAALKTAEKAELSPAQREQLLDGLMRLKVILTNYRSTLLAVDEKALELTVAERTEVARKMGVTHKGSITSAISTTVATAEDLVDTIAEESGEMPDIGFTEEEILDSDLETTETDGETTDDVADDMDTDAGETTLEETAAEIEEENRLDAEAEASLGITVDDGEMSATATEEAEVTQ